MTEDKNYEISMIDYQSVDDAKIKIICTLQELNAPDEYIVGILDCIKHAYLEKSAYSEVDEE